MAQQDSAPAPSRWRIYTRTGDGGSSQLYTGQKLAKDHAYFQALGDVDELNSCLGIARAFIPDSEESLREQIATIQSRLIDVGSCLATPATTQQVQRVKHTRLGSQHTPVLEEWIDRMDDILPPLRNFILPSGGPGPAFLHQARSVCRRAERAVVALARCTATQQPQANKQPQTRQQQPDSLAHDSSHTDAAGDSNGHTCDDPSLTNSHTEGECEEVIVQSDALDPDVGVFLNRLSDYLFTAARYLAYQNNAPEQVYQKAPPPE